MINKVHSYTDHRGAIPRLTTLIGLMKQSSCLLLAVTLSLVDAGCSTSKHVRNRLGGAGGGGADAGGAGTNKDGQAESTAPGSAALAGGNSLGGSSATSATAKFAWEISDLPACIAARGGAQVFVWRTQSLMKCNKGNGKWEVGGAS